MCKSFRYKYRRNKLSANNNASRFVGICGAVQDYTTRVCVLLRAVSFRRRSILGEVGDFAAKRDDRSRCVFANEIARLLLSGLSHAIPISRSPAASKAGTPQLGPGP